MLSGSPSTSPDFLVDANNNNVNDKTPLIQGYLYTYWFQSFTQNLRDG